MAHRTDAAERWITNPEHAAALAGACVKLAILAVLGMVAGFGYVVWDATRPDRTRYFASNPNLEPYPIKPLDAPVMDTPALLQWAQDAALAAYNVDFVRYLEQGQRASVNFEPEAWRQWKASFVRNHNLAKLTDAKLIASAVAQRPPVVKREGVANGRYAWEVQFVMNYALLGSNLPVSEVRKVTVLVARTDDPRFPRGVAIAQMVDGPVEKATAAAVAGR